MVVIVISIPYGSIKSRCTSSDNRMFRISIPYGSIKSARANKIIDLNKEFQFLMVQLKENVIFLKLLSTFISIPYGSIKSLYLC